VKESYSKSSAQDEALDVVGAAASIAVMEVRSYVGLEAHEFDGWVRDCGWD
jgi:hypothetical protein